MSSLVLNSLFRASWCFFDGLNITVTRRGGVIRALATAVFPSGTKVPENKPRWKNCQPPECKVQVNTTDMRHNRHGFETVADSLPGGFCPTKKSGISNDFFLGLGQILYDEVAGIVESVPSASKT